MPKITTHSLKFKDEYKTFDVWYNSKDGFYYKNFPDSMWKFVQSASSGDCPSKVQETEQGLRSATQKMLDLYYELTKTERHIIILRLSFSVAIYMNKMERDSGRGYSGYKPWAQQHHDFIISQSHGLDHGIAFEYQTGIEIEGKNKYFYPTRQDETGAIIHREAYGSRITGEDKHRKAIVLDYSLELETFLKGVAEQMEALAAKMLNFFSDKDRILLAAQNQTKLIGQ